MVDLGKAAQDGGGGVRGEHFSLRHDRPANAPGQEQLGNYCEAMLSQGVWGEKKSLLVSPSHPWNTAAKITHWPHRHHIHLCGAPGSPLDVGTKFTFHTLELKVFITPPLPQEPFFHLCLMAHCCASPSLISPAVSLPPTNYKFKSTRNTIRTCGRSFSIRRTWMKKNSDKQTSCIWAPGSRILCSARRVRN